MSTNELSFGSQQLHRNHPDYLPLAIKQLKKDFEMVGAEIELIFASKPNYSEALAKLQIVVGEMTKTDHNTLFNLLYRIDLSEKKVAKAVAVAVDLPFEKIVAELILDRELQKVVIREHFKEGNN